MPLEFFYFESISTFFGGHVVYYLGTYGYVTEITSLAERWLLNSQKINNGIP